MNVYTNYMNSNCINTITLLTNIYLIIKNYYYNLSIEYGNIQQKNRYGHELHLQFTCQILFDTIC